MNFLEAFKIALSNIMASKMRSFLTMLGIIIGVAAVIVIVGLGNGMQLYLTEQFEELGTNSLNVIIMGRGSGRSVSVDQMYDMVDRHPDRLTLISPVVTMQGQLKIGAETSSTASISGVSEDYLEGIKAYKIVQGRNLVYVDMRARSRVCVIGSYINQEYFGGKGLGQRLRINGNPFTVVGILDEEADGEESSTDDAVYLPYSTAARMSQMGRIGNYVVTIPDVDNASASKELLTDELYKIFHDENAYRVVSMAEMLDMMNSMIGVLITVLALIAGISLVVGGIGIMNIMLVSVSERTREIGIRKALGAAEGYIMCQFVIEAATTSAIGGALGILLGEGLSSVATMVVSSLMEIQMSVTPSAGSILMAAGISIGIGILFGYLPAKKAAQLNPIDALRYE